LAVYLFTKIKHSYRIIINGGGLVCTDSVWRGAGSRRFLPAMRCRVTCLDTWICVCARTAPHPGGRVCGVCISSTPCRHAARQQMPCAPAVSTPPRSCARHHGRRVTRLRTPRVRLAAIAGFGTFAKGVPPVCPRHMHLHARTTGSFVFFYCQVRRETERMLACLACQRDETTTRVVDLLALVPA